jgi:hypothetical protein
MTNSSLTDFLLQTLTNGDSAAALSRRLGTDESQTKSALEVAVPLLIGALGKNAEAQTGAEKLDGALRRDHDGSVLQHVGDYLSDGGNRSEGEAILKHVLGGKIGKAEKGVAQTTGMEQSQAGALLEILAPLVLGALGKAQGDKGLDAEGVAGVLQKERRQTEQSKSPIAALITDIIDGNDDGNVMDDIVGMAMRFFGGNRTS